MSEIIDYLWDSTSAINKSWLCFDSNNNSSCSFLYIQQFHRPNHLVGSIEGIILISISILSIPTNFWAIYNYSRKQMNMELQILIYALCFYNFLSVPINVINGLARMNDNFPMGNFGCFIAVPFACSLNNATSLTLALISFERKTIITSRVTDSNTRSRVKKISIILIMINIFSFSTYSLLFYIKFDLAVIIQYPVYGPDRPPVDICLPQTDKYGIPLDAFFSLVHFIIPLTITTYNYSRIWIETRRMKRSSLSTNNNHRMNIFFSRLMFACLAEFVICQLPFDTVLGIAWWQERTGNMVLQSTAVFLCYIILYFDSVLNPLWFSFVTLTKTTRGIGPRVSISFRIKPSMNRNFTMTSQFSYTA